MNKPLKQSEFVTLIALVTSLSALAIDAMLPALSTITDELNLVDPNRAQLVISFIFIGMCIGQLIYGPVSDAIGRRKPLIVGLLIFIAGSFISAVSLNFEVMLIGRLLQGLGAASTRVVTTAIIRDYYSGNSMAKVMSLIMMIFVIVPAVAPSLGQLILLKYNWRAIFYLLMGLSILGLIWFCIRMPESLTPSKRRSISFNNLKEATIETLTNKNSMVYTISAGLIFGAFIGYLSSSAQIFDDVFDQKENFPILFGTLALSIGSASFFNAKLVDKIGMKCLTLNALKALSTLAATYITISYFTDSSSNLVLFLGYMLLSFFCIGILFGNFNALAISPLGHIAGIATAIISSVQTFIFLIFGTVIGQLYNLTVYPLVIGFLILSTLSFILIKKFTTN